MLRIFWKCRTNCWRSIVTDISNARKNIEWPRKTGELFHNHFDSTLWNDFPFRDDDIIIATYAKSGTTWLQQIVAQLLFNGEAGYNVGEMSPWVDMRLPPWEEKRLAIEAQSHRRFLKTHLPVDALVYSPKAKYLYVARDGRDVVWSFYNHHQNFNDLWYEVIDSVCPAGIEPFKRTEDDVLTYFRNWMDKDGYPLWNYWGNIASWWAIRDLPNLKVVHFSALKTDMPGQIREIASFLDIPIDENRWDAILEHCTFKYMQANAELSAPMGGVLWKGGAKTFIHKGSNGRWRDVLSREDNERYEATAIEKLGAECAHWLATGELVG
jgi:aryl sulfotransferase